MVAAEAVVVAAERHRAAELEWMAQRARAVEAAVDRVVLDVMSFQPLRGVTFGISRQLCTDDALRITAIRA